MTNLSPAAQAVLQAYKRGGLNAALEAAADQVVPENYKPPRTAFHPEAGAFVDGKECRNEAVRYQLLAIAAELRGVTTTTTDTP